MEKVALKSLDVVFKQISADIRHLRAGYQALVRLAAFNGAGDAMALTVSELEAATEQLVKDARAFAKAVAELATTESVRTESPIEG